MPEHGASRAGVAIVELSEDTPLVDGGRRFNSSGYQSRQSAVGFPLRPTIPRGIPRLIAWNRALDWALGAGVESWRRESPGSGLSDPKH